VLLLVALAVFAVVYRLNQQPYAFDRLTRFAAVAYTEGRPDARAYLDGGRVFLGHTAADGRFDLRSVDVDDPGGAPIWANTSLSDVDTFRAARGSVLVTSLPDQDGRRRVTLLNASNGVAFAAFEVRDGDRWALVGKYFLRYRGDDHRLVVTDVSKLDKPVTFDQPGGAQSWWLTDNWSGQQVPTSVGGEQLDEPLTVDPHIVRAVPGDGLEVVSLSTGKAVATASGIAGPEDLVYPYDDQVFVAAGGQLRAYDRSRLGKPQWTWSAPDRQTRPKFATVCGEHRVCVAEEHHVTALDTRTGEVAFRLDVDDASRLLPTGDRIMVRSVSARGGDATERLIDADGRVLRSWPDRRAARLDEGSFLLLPATMPASGGSPWQGVEAGNGATRDLGTLDVRLDSCTWSHTYLVCAAPGEFVFYRVRSPWYANRL